MCVCVCVCVCVHACVMKLGVKVPWNTWVLWAPTAWVTPLSLLNIIMLPVIDLNESFSAVKIG